ncbi:MarR family winged helix-turn-helix transcriptional regulator [Aeromicrobium choanae]|uniref:DNA-binding transcriptional regulator, MarR family n=1 Tax=Aeromicrobium choanae TaxID=1736691 RepID=A0A1T4Z5X7_9ACTN|nr:MarR family transcriptional regulator [Aeromicrobium choanae]SKB08981.1 DNA-binding transcriptional regulator, MarR family [Aeromicrobium choanae]
MTEWLDAEEQRTWRGVLAMHDDLMTALAQGLKAQSDLSAADYAVLANLSEAPDGVLRARELRCLLRWEKSRLAHHIRRMEQRGLVRRDACLDDGRAPLVSITADGRTAIDAAAPTHVAQVRELFFDVLTPAQLTTLREAAEAVVARIALSEDDADAGC